MTTALLWYAGLCALLGALLVLVMVVQKLAPLLTRTRSSVSELSQTRLERPLRPAA